MLHNVIYIKHFLEKLNLISRSMSSCVVRLYRFYYRLFKNSKCNIALFSGGELVSYFPHSTFTHNDSYPCVTMTRAGVLENMKCEYKCFFCMSHTSKETT